jgi:hypothetical protein
MIVIRIFGKLCVVLAYSVLLGLAMMFAVFEQREGKHHVD